MSDDDKSQFLRTTLVPERIGGGKTETYQLTADSVHPTKVVGRDEYGQVIDETIPICKHREFVTRSGCINNVPIRTAPGNAPDHEALQIEQYTIARVIRNGFLPVDECPFTLDYRTIVGGPLVKPKAGEVACEGKVGGCEHLHRVMAMRRERSLAQWRAEEDKAARMKSEEIANLATAVGQAIAANQSGAIADLKAARKGARDTRSSEE